MPTAPPEASEASSARPLVVSADDELVEDLLRLAAAADVERPWCAAAAARACRSWASLVVVGDDQTGRR